MAATLLIYHMEDARRQILEGLCRSMGIRPVSVGEDGYRVPIGLLSGSVPLGKLAAGAFGQNGPAGNTAKGVRNQEKEPIDQKGGADRGSTDSGGTAREEMIVMCGFTKTQFDNLLEMLKMAGLRISLKAVETPTNQMWNGEMLLGELSREREAFARRRAKTTRE